MAQKFLTDIEVSGKLFTTDIVGIGVSTLAGQEGSANGSPILQVGKTGTTGSYNLVSRFGTDQDADNSGASVLINAGNDRGLLISAGRGSSNRAISHLNLIQYDGSELTDGITLSQHAAGSSGATTGTYIGIGTDSPSQKLEVEGNVAVTGTNVTVANASNPYIYINDTNAGAGIFQQEGNTTRIGSDSNTQVVLIQNNATAVTIDTSKNVGIGTTGPENKLHVQQSALFTGIHSTAGIRVKSDGASAYGNYHGTIALSRGTGSVAISAVQEAADSDVMGMAFFTHPSVTGGDAAVEQMRINSDGTVGIGTNALDTPGGDKLHVDGTLRVGPYFSTSDRDHIKLIPHGTDSKVYSPNERFHIENPSGHIVLTPDTSGGVGIGLDDPDAKVSIYQDGGTVLDVQGSDGQLFSVTDDLTGDLFSVSDISGMPIFNVNSSGAITFNGYIPDNNKLKFGNSEDLEIYHDGSNSYIQDTGTGNLIITASSSLQLKSADDEFYMIGNADGQVALYNNGIKKFETTSTGVEVVGNITMAANATVDGVDISALPTSFAPINAEQNVQSDWNATTGDAFILNKPSTFPPSSHNHDGDYIQDGGTTAISNINTIGTESIKHRWNNVTTGRPASSQANEYGTVTTLTYDSSYATQLAWDIHAGNLYGRTLNLGDDTGTWVKFAKDGDYVPASGGTFAGGVVNINTNTNTNTLNISRSGGNSAQVMKIGVTDTVATFNYIEDTTGEGNGNFGQYQFKLGGNDGETTVTGLAITKTGISAPNFSGTSSGTNTGDQTNISGNSATTTLAANSSKLGGYTLDQIDHAEAFHTFDNIDAASAQAKRYHIGRLYGCPAHWDGNWQNIEFNVTAESYESGHLRYKLMGDYGGSGSQANMMDLYLKEASGPMVGRFRFVLGTPVDAGWDHSGQDTFYVDLYAEAAHYSQWKINIKTYGHGIQNSNPTSGGATTVFYDSPTSSNITTFDEGHLAIHHLGNEIYHEGHKPTLAELGAAADTVVNQTDFVSAAFGGTFAGTVNISPGSSTVSTLNLRRNTTGDSTIVGDVNFVTSAAEGTDDRIGLIRVQTSAGDATTRGGEMRVYTRQSGSSAFNTTIYDKAGNWSLPSNLTVGGNLTVEGTVTTLNTQTVEVEDNILQLNTTQGTPDTATAATSGISIYRGDGVTQASLIFDDGDDTWDLTNDLTVAGDVIGASFAVPSGASTGFLKADGSVDGTTYSGYNFGGTDLTFQGADPGDIVWKDADGTEVHRIWSGTNDYLTYRNDAGTAYGIIHEGFSGYNNGDWDNAFTHAESAHAPTNAEANVYSNATELLTGLNTLTNPIFTNGLSKKNLRYQSGITSEYPLGHYTPGETLFEIDTTWSNAELQSYFDTPNVSWDEVANAPGGYAIYINGSNGVGGPYSSGFPMIPIDEDATYYQECWIKNATSSTMGHYMGSADLEADRTPPSSGAGNPGSYGYWVMSNTNPGDTWTKVSGYITGHHASNTGSFETDATYFTPLALFNYTTPAAGTRACWISGWKVIRVDKVGDRIFQDDVQVKGKLEVHTLDANTSSTTALVMNGNEVEKRTLGSRAFDSTSYLPLAGGTMTGDLRIENGGPKIYLKDTTDDDDQAIYFQNNGGTIEYLISTQDFTQDGLGDGMFIGSISNDELGLVTNNTTALYIDTSQNSKFFGNIKVNQFGLIDFAQNEDVDGAEVVAQVSTSTYTAAFFDYVIKKGSNVRAGIVYACHDGSNNVEFSETSTTDLGNTSDVALSVDISSGNMRLIADSDTNDWSVKTLIRAI